VGTKVSEAEYGAYRRARSLKLSEWVREVLLTAARGDEAGSAAHLCERWSGTAQVLRCALFSSKFSFISKMKTTLEPLCLFS